MDGLPSKAQVFDYWKHRLSDLGFFIDWGEPGCWACGFHYGIKYDIRRPNESWDKILDCWNKVPLQRCHIVPRSLGGTNDVSNIFLMCRECHDLAPNSSIPEIFFKWARSQSFYVRDLSKIQAAFDSFGIAPSKQKDFCELIASEEFKSWVSGKFGLHRPQSNYASRLARLTPATMIGLAVEYQRTHKMSP